MFIRRPRTCWVVAPLLALSLVQRAVPGNSEPHDKGQAAKVDAHVLATPADAEKGLGKLARHLTSPWKDDFSKARAIYRWISDRIAYDAEGFFSGKIQRYSAGEVLERRKGVCDGYSNLFVGLCQLSGMQAVKITGYAKGYGYIEGNKFDKPNHAWNAVKIDGKWKLLNHRARLRSCVKRHHP